MRANNLTLLVYNLSALWLPAARAQERTVIAIWDEADLLALWLLRRRESARAWRTSSTAQTAEPALTS